MKRLALVCAAHMLFIENDQVLLGRRRNTSFAEGMYHVPAGHLEPGESMIAAAQRETLEEVGVSVEPEDLELVHVMHHHEDLNEDSRIALFFRVHAWSGKITNAEPHKCDGWEWFLMTDLPSDTVGYAAEAIRHVRNGAMHSTRNI